MPGFLHACFIDMAVLGWTLIVVYGSCVVGVNDGVLRCWWVVVWPILVYLGR